MNTKSYDVVILGAGGAGLMCAIEAGKRGRKVAVLDHSDKVGKKILISGGGRCNFTNIGASAERYISENRHFCKSAFSQFTPNDFISLVKKHHIAFHEKKLGQQFCDESAQNIVDMLLAECQSAGVDIYLNCQIDNILKNEIKQYVVNTSLGCFLGESLVVATGGLSIPKMGATPLGYKIAEQFGVEMTEVAPALVPFTFHPQELELYESLSGISFDAEVSCGKISFRENVLMTHRGMSGPAILQISSYWRAGQEVRIHILPDMDWQAFLKEKRNTHAKQELRTILSDVLPKRMIQRLIDKNMLLNRIIGEIGDKQIREIEHLFTHFMIKPNGTEGYRKAEVTRGGVSTKSLDARTLEAKECDGLFFIGEVVDVTGWLGGYNFQWAWSSGFAAGQVV